ncbi:hypothetical protein L3X38_041060 [Prunus dulcis]|uniref:Uncharacterized protein n=1 Tax=Prunus dulcis TaxID=3755 RepID=A0AAD4YIH7_PRUDU|nr:hypothetical protein L3X38_041060 [Prunus dulcis]
MKPISLSEEDECEDDDNGDSYSIFQVSDWGFTRKLVSSVLYIFEEIEAWRESHQSLKLDWKLGWVWAFNRKINIIFHGEFRGWQGQKEIKTNLMKGQ